LNPLYDGVSNTSLLSPGQSLNNQTGTSNDYFIKVIVQCRVTNLNIFSTYLNSAIGKGTIGNSATASLINVSDSSNNGSQAVVDPNNNGNASESGENIPTPFHFGTVPVHFVNVNASFIAPQTALIKWTVATPTVNANMFEVEYSNNGTSWTIIENLPITDPAQALYQFTHSQVPAANAYYRIRETDKDGTYIYSKIVLLQRSTNEPVHVIVPNPANSYLQVMSNAVGSSKTLIEMFDAVGRKVLTKQLLNSVERINTANFPNGTYLLKLSYNGNVRTQKVLIIHQ
jgi:hypothetical protein